MVVTPCDRVEEVEVQLGLEVGAALRARPPPARRAPPAAAATAAEQAAEQVAEVGAVDVEADAADAAGQPPPGRRPEAAGRPSGPSARTSSYSLRLSASPSTS